MSVCAPRSEVLVGASDLVGVELPGYAKETLSYYAQGP